jgi:hypothetical protein
MEIDKYMLKSVVQYLKEYHNMMTTHIDNLNDKESEAYKSTAKQVEANGYTDVPKEIENMRINIMNNSMNIEEIINDLSKKGDSEKEKCNGSCCDTESEENVKKEEEVEEVEEVEENEKKEEEVEEDEKVEVAELIQ